HHERHPALGHPAPHRVAHHALVLRELVVEFQEVERAIEIHGAVRGPRMEKWPRILAFAAVACVKRPIARVSRGYAARAPIAPAAPCPARVTRGPVAGAGPGRPRRTWWTRRPRSGRSRTSSPPRTRASSALSSRARASSGATSRPA